MAIFHLTMGLEELRFLFLSMRITGLLPHDITPKEKSFRSLRFRYGWRYGVTWWFGIFALLEIASLISFAINILSYYAQQKKSLTVLAVMFIWEISYVFLRLTPLLFIFHATRFKNALECFGKIDRVLEMIPQRNVLTVRRRTVIGLTLGIILVYTSIMIYKIKDIYHLIDLIF